MSVTVTGRVGMSNSDSESQASFGRDHWHHGTVTGGPVTSLSHAESRAGLGCLIRVCRALEKDRPFETRHSVEDVRRNGG